MLGQPLLLVRRHGIAVKTGHQQVLVLRGGSRDYLQVGQDAIQLRRCHSAELGALHGFPTLGEDTALARNGLGRLDVVPSHHPHHHTGATGSGHSGSHIRTQGILDTHDAIAHHVHVQLRWAGGPVLR